MGILHIVVDPYTMKKPKRFQARRLSCRIILIKGVVEVIVKRNVDTNGVGAHLLHEGKPAQIGFLVDGIVGSPFAGDSHAEIDPLDGKRLRTVAAIQIKALFICAHKSRNRLIGAQINVPPQIVTRRIIGKVGQNQGGENDNELFHGSALLP